ncbi:MAG: sulfatase-like hydrolase/transferase [Acidobacteria bacterium]|nr:sulfatase-like hydrolase/transferase [Acidobacteriota bacterium]
MTRRDWLRTALATPFAQTINAQARKPNIVLIVADDLGYAGVGCYGNQQIKTPNIDRLASEGMRFTDFVVSWPACTPSRSSILTGRYPQRNGLYDMIRNNEVNWKYQYTEETYAVSPEMTIGMDTREVTIGQALKQAGYTTGVIGKWDGGRAKRFLPLQRGFDFYYGFANTGIDYYTHERYGVASMFRGNERIKEQGHATDLFLREALAFLKQNRTRPFFLYLPFNAPHGASTFHKDDPQEEPKYMERYKHLPKGIAQTAAWTTHLDDAVGAIMAELKAIGQDENTLVIFSSDNGGTGAAYNGPLRGKKAQMYEGGIRVPMIARWPGRIAKGAVNNDFVSSLEYFPTFLAVTGAPAPRGVKLDGFNLLSVLEGKAKSQRTDFCWQRQGDKAARSGNWKWVDSEDGGGLFDLSTDLGEKHDLSKDKPEIYAKMKAKWEAWRKEMDASEPRGPFRDY